jgi:hypothetical protein
MMRLVGAVGMMGAARVGRISIPFSFSTTIISSDLYMFVYTFGAVSSWFAVLANDYAINLFVAIVIIIGIVSIPPNGTDASWVRPRSSDGLDIVVVALFDENAHDSWL